MSVDLRGLTRIAGGFLFVFFMTMSGPLALAADSAKPQPIPHGLMCTDGMETEPGTDDYDPTEISDTLDGAPMDDAMADTGACNGTTPVAI